MYEAATARPAHKAIVGLAGILGPSGMLAYVSYMAERLEQMHRLLKPTGSLYYHCDPTASHYLKIVLDNIFGGAGFINEVSWRRTTTKGDYRQGAMNWPRVRDVILHYAKGGARRPFNQPFAPYDQKYVDSHYGSKEPGTSRRYRLDNLTAPGAGSRGHPKYEFPGVTRYWRYAKQKMEQLYAEGRVVQTAPGRVLAYKRYLDEIPGSAIGDSWEDVAPINSQAKERLGYPTQKPVPLLERIIAASSNKGDVVLDPFCGCGTTIDAARRLNRRWVGIDMSAFAIDLIRDRRLQDRTIPTYGTPADLLGARKLAADKPFDFESWAVTRLPGFAPNMQQRGDGGVDGRATIAIRPDNADSRLALAQVKGGRFAVSYLRDFRHVIDGEKAAVGCFVTLDPAPARHRADAKTASVVLISGQSCDRLNLWSIADYFEQRLPALPAMTDPYSGRPLSPQQRLI